MKIKKTQVAALVVSAILIGGVITAFATSNTTESFSTHMSISEARYQEALKPY